MSYKAQLSQHIFITSAAVLKPGLSGNNLQLDFRVIIHGPIFNVELWGVKHMSKGNYCYSSVDFCTEILFGRLLLRRCLLFWLSRQHGFVASPRESGIRVVGMKLS